ncbi:hypothetical protein BDF14DRAFT_1772721 [Spinellus fusiger]|nr:hypothetical protein BDF14DRAFT_1772721 [Spinellus fusiger]
MDKDILVLFWFYFTFYFSLLKAYKNTFFFFLFSLFFFQVINTAPSTRIINILGLQ